MISKEVLEGLIAQEIAAINNIPLEGDNLDSINATVELILNNVHQKRGKIVVSGMGKAGQIGHNIATTFASTGSPALFLHPAEAQHGDLGILRENDVLILLSNSGKTREVVELIQLAKNLYPEIKIVSILGNTDSPMGNASDHVISTGKPKEICPLDLTPTSSTTCMTVIGDLLIVETMKAIGFTKEQYAKFHHSGYLNLKAKGLAE